MNKEARNIHEENVTSFAFLEDEYKKVMEKIDVYIISKDIYNIDRESIRRDIINMLYEGQKRKQPVQEIIGYDYKTFCDTFLSSVNEMTKKEKFMGHLSMFMLAFAVSFLLIPASNLFKSGVITLELNVYLMNLINIILMYFYLILIRKQVNRFVFKKYYLIVYCGIYILFSEMVRYLEDIFSVTLFTLNLFVYLIIQVGLFMAWKYLDNKL